MKQGKIFMTGLLLMAAFSVHAQKLGVFLYDEVGNFTNVRNAPQGAVVSKIPHGESPVLVVHSPKNGWWRIDANRYEVAETGKVSKLKGSKSGYWVHYSVLGLGTRNYGGQKLTLRKHPSANSAAVYTFQEEMTVRPVDISGDWVKVKTLEGHTGWIEAEWLCDNPLTNCC